MDATKKIKKLTMVEILKLNVFELKEYFIGFQDNYSSGLMSAKTSNDMKKSELILGILQTQFGINFQLQNQTEMIEVKNYQSETKNNGYNKIVYNY